MKGPNSPYRVEVNPWTSDQDLERVLLLRGAYIGAVAQIETVMAEFTVRCSNLPEYRDIRLKFPKHRNDRVSFLECVATLPGALSRYRKLIEGSVEKYRLFYPLRDMLAHARMGMIFVQGTNGLIKFQQFKGGEGAEVEWREEPVYLNDFEAMARKACRSARAITYLCHRADKILPTLISL